MIVIGYVRRSKKSNDRNVSLDEQQKQIEDYCAKRNFLVGAWVRHDGVSGTKRGRFDEITKALTEHKANGLVFYHLDRLARDASGLIEYLKSLREKKIQIHETLSGEIKSDRALDKFQTGMRGVVDQFYRDIISEKTTDALQYLKSTDKRYANHAPFGYRHEVVGYDEQAKKPRFKLVVDVEEQRALELIQSCRLAGLGARKTRRVLESAQFLGRMGLATLHKLLRDPPETLKSG